MEQHEENGPAGSGTPAKATKATTYIGLIGLAFFVGLLLGFSEHAKIAAMLGQ